jgi:hypothetical protein
MSRLQGKPGPLLTSALFTAAAALTLVYLWSIGLL